MLRWSEQDLAEYLKRRQKPDTSAPPFKLPANEAGAFALGRLPPGTMNKSEARYAEHLEARVATREILWWKFEAIKLRLADACFYTPDFAVLPVTGVLELHEVKGFWQDDARVKIKVAAALFPFRFIAVTAIARKHGGGWNVEEFS